MLVDSYVDLPAALLDLISDIPVLEGDSSSSSIDSNEMSGISDTLVLRTLVNMYRYTVGMLLNQSV